MQRLITTSTPDEKKTHQYSQDTDLLEVTFFQRTKPTPLDRIKFWLTLSDLEITKNVTSIKKHPQHLEKIETGMYKLFQVKGNGLTQGTLDMLMLHPAHADYIGEAFAAVARCLALNNSELNKMIKLELEKLTEHPEKSREIAGNIAKARAEFSPKKYQP